MLGNGYKERLANAQSSIGSLLLNLSKPASPSPAPHPTQENNPEADLPLKHTAFTPFYTKLSSNSPLPPAPALESNSASRHGSQRQQRTSRLPAAGFNIGRLMDQYQEADGHDQNNSQGARTLDDFPLLSSNHDQGFPPLHSKSPSPWDRVPSLYEGSSTPLSNSPKEVAPFIPVKTGTWNNVTKSMTTIAHSKEHDLGPEGYGNAALVQTVLTLQRAIRRFLLRKRTREAKITTAHQRDVQIPVSQTPVRQQGSTNATIQTGRRQSSPAQISRTATPKGTNKNGKESMDLEALQQTCLRQSEEINQLKELMTKLCLEAEADRQKLKQRDRELEDLLKLSAANASSTNDQSSRGPAKPAPSTLNTRSSTFGVASPPPGSDNPGGSADDQRKSVSGIAGDEVYDSNQSYSAHLAGPPIHPLSMQARSNSIHSMSSQPSSTNQGLKVNPIQPSSAQQGYFQQYSGFADINGLVESPSTTEFDPTTPSGFPTGRGLVSSQHGYNSQPSFPMLSHRSSGSFSSASRAFESPALEQQGSYPWGAGGGLTHSQSWADDMTTGYVYDASSSQTPGQYQHAGGMAHSGAYDPQYASQQFSHGSAAVGQQTYQQQQHSSLPPYRNNYRRHSDKPVHLDYQVCVDRILQATDQQASIHLQQKLKTSPPDQKVLIIDAILGQAYPLMSNRFGNFLIQRCFEFGSPQQVDALAQAMRGNILTLACDPFGCHVVQKALDNVEEDCKARIVTEMFRRIRETIVHRYACHVWQKVFEIRWTDAPPAVMTYVNNAVGGRWSSVAVDETGSLVVQNIFENCAEHDKRPVLNEILQSVTTIAKGQWGNWVIQHILEHGAPADRATVTQKILENAVNLSLDQYASKVVEKTLRMAAMMSSSLTSTSLASIGGNAITAPPTVTVNGTTIEFNQEEVMGQYIHIVCDGVQDRPRIPLIDIAADQYGNYIVQYILTNAGPQHRETCAALIKRHMVSLRGSKYGQKVAFMVERWRGSPFSGGNGGGSLGQGSGAHYLGSSKSGQNLGGNASSTNTGPSLDTTGTSNLAGRRRW